MTGLPLAIKVTGNALLNHKAMEVIAAAGVDYFRGRTIWELELAMSDLQGASPSGYVREIQASTEDTYHFMSVVPGRESTLLILVTDKTANLGLGWLSMRQALAHIAKTTPPEQGKPQRPEVGRDDPRIIDDDIVADQRDSADESESFDRFDNFEVYNPRWRGGRGVRRRPH